MAENNDNQQPAAEKQPKEQQPKQQQKGGAKKDKKAGDSQVDISSIEKPEYVAYRLAMWDEIKKRREAELEAKGVKGKPIKITLPDGKVVEGQAFITTPLDIAAGISKSLAENVVVAKLNGDTLWDLARPLEDDCSMELIKFDSKEGQYLFWHSSAHILGQAMERLYHCKLCTGPPVKDGAGFFYEAYMDDKIVHQEDYPILQKIVDTIIAEKQPYERLVVTKEEALELFKYNKYKYEILASKVPDGGHATVYRCGDLIDPCRGPHLPNTGRVKAFAITRNSSSYWKGDANNESLQRIYAVSFPDQKSLKEWQKFQEEAAKRDHRLIGKNQELWFFHPLSPGSTFFLPHGARIYNALLELMRSEYRKRGYEEAITPNIFNVNLWETSGHWQNYKENMFSFKCEDATFALKPMNCPGHCLMFASRPRSYRELPLRIADFGVLHRNEFSGALSGMTRVRRFQQDDAHIFCAMDQINVEIKNVLGFIKHIYDIFGFKFHLNLSTRPQKYLGEIEIWNKAEKELEKALNEFGQPWALNPGDGAFYGPKIDITMEDALKRQHQCATIQLDFQLPIRFDLSYQTSRDESSNGSEEKPQDGAAAPGSRLERPVIIHRAVLGSFERFIAILTENCAGKWPFWLSPRQVIVLPVSEKQLEYAKHVRDEIHAAGYYVDVDASDAKLAKKVLHAQNSQYNFILVVGQQEVEEKSVNIRTRDNVVHGTKTIPELLAWFAQLKNEYK